MHWTTDIDPKIKEIELRKQPVIPLHSKKQSRNTTRLNKKN